MTFTPTNRLRAKARPPPFAEKAKDGAPCAWARGEFDKQIIMNARGYDFNIDQHKTLLQKIDYCHKNPITRGLVERAADWRWSSYRYYEHDDSSVLKMNWDGDWPIVW